MKRNHSECDSNWVDEDDLQETLDAEAWFLNYGEECDRIEEAVFQGKKCNSCACILESSNFTFFYDDVLHQVL